MTDKTIVLTGLLACICLTSKAQDAKSAEPTGKAIIQMFANFNTGLFEQNDTRAFYLERSYLGYEYDLDDGLSVKGVIDIGKSSDVDDYQRLAYIKNALVSWKTGGLTLTGGLISTTQFNFQEKFWGYRYILKPFQDRYNFGYSADLGEISGVKMAKMLKNDIETAEIPIIFCTARDTEDDMIMGLNIGADDYIMKPYTVRNVIARVKSVLRRTSGYKSGAPVEKTNIVKIEGLHLDLEFKRCTVDGVEVNLTRKEFELLAYLISHRGKICSREQILSNVWSDEVVVLDRTIDVNITRVRSKIGPYGSYIVTRSGFGYGFRD
jgi:two-component system alkaline phosphatase synthesis response regulator PhoP